METSLNIIKQLIEEKFGIQPASLQDDKPLQDYGLDSLSLVELLFTIEEHFDIELPDDKEQLDTLAGLAALVDQIRQKESQ